jgi:agmatine deiminase
MPAEWEPHEATWIAWPHNRADWPGRFTPIPWVYADIVRNLSQVERVRILVNDEAAKDKAARLLRKVDAEMSAVEFFLLPTNRVWTRDYGPIFVKSQAGRVAVTNWKFNAWAKYGDWQLDNSVPGKLAPKLGMQMWTLDVVLEGGSIDVNGQGALLTTEECLLSKVQARNPNLSRAQLEHQLQEALGLTSIVWLRNGIAGDDTHGHVDDLARFVDAHTIVIASEMNQKDANYAPLAQNHDLLKQHPYRVVKLPMPRAVIFDGVRLPASYANLYIANDLVLVPTFNDANDRIALRILADLFPRRRIVGINCLELVWGLGTLHCMTQQQPA